MLSILDYPILPDPGPAGAVNPPAAPTSGPTTLMTVSYGSPIWVFILVAVLTAIVTAAATVLVARRVHRAARTQAYAL